MAADFQTPRSCPGLRGDGSSVEYLFKGLSNQIFGILCCSVSDPDSFFTDPDPGNKKQIFFKAKTKFWEKFLLSTQKVCIFFLLSTNQVGILLNRELLFGRYHF